MWPITSFFDQQVNNGSKRLVEEHSNKWPSKRILLQVNEEKKRLLWWPRNAVSILFLNIVTVITFFSCLLSDLALDWKQGWGDLALIQTSLLFICKCELVSITTA